MTFSHQFTQYAAICVDNETSFVSTPRTQWTTVWSNKGFRSAKGRCVAVRCDGKSVVQVAVIKDGIRRWYPIASVLTDEQISYWSTTDTFTHR